MSRRVTSRCKRNMTPSESEPAIGSLALHPALFLGRCLRASVDHSTSGGHRLYPRWRHAPLAIKGHRPSCSAPSPAYSDCMFFIGLIRPMSPPGKDGVTRRQWAGEPRSAWQGNVAPPLMSPRHPRFMAALGSVLGKPGGPA